LGPFKRHFAKFATLKKTILFFSRFYDPLERLQMSKLPVCERGNSTPQKF